MKTKVSVLPFIAALVLLVRFAAASQPLPRSAPEAQGVSSQDVLAFVQAADRTIHTMHSFMVVRHGVVVAEGWWKPEAPDKPHVMWSVSKSFTSTAVGLAIADGKLSLDDHILKFFPEQAPPDPSDNLKAMTVSDLLSMSCGQQSEIKFNLAGGQTPTVKAFLAQPVPHKPGTFFMYNTPGTYMLSAIVTKVTGQTVYDYLKPRLFEPLGIDDATWDASPEGYSLGGYGLHICTEDLAKFGQLYLQKGKWHGQQLIPESWVALATSKHIDNSPAFGSDRPDWRQGYCFQFWRSRHNAFRADGRDCQFCIVIPDEDAVIAITSDSGAYQGELNLVWDHLLPSLRAQPLPPDPEADRKLTRRNASAIQAWKLPPDPEADRKLTEAAAALEVHVDKK